MRLEGRMRLGYYPLDSREAQRIRRFLQFPNEPASVLDPCAGTGAALLATREVIDAFSAQGAEPFRTAPAEFAALVRSDIEKWAVVVRESGAKVD